MSKIDDGGMAFPIYYPTEVETETGVVAAAFVAKGMSLRDWFAGQAMLAVATMVARGVHDIDRPGGFGFAADCYELADKMLAARKTGGE